MIDLNFQISQSSVATQLGCCWNLYHSHSGSFFGNLTV